MKELHSLARTSLKPVKLSYSRAKTQKVINLKRSIIMGVNKRLCNTVVKLSIVQRKEGE